MKINIRYPFSLRGIPEGKRSEKYIYASYDFPHDVSVVDPSETQVVLTSHQAYTHADFREQFSGKAAGWGKPPVAQERSKPFEVRKYNGRLYKYCCPLSEMETRLQDGPHVAGTYDNSYFEDTLSTVGHPAWANPMLGLHNLCKTNHRFMLRDEKRAGFQWVTWIDETFPPFDSWRQTMREYRLQDIVDAEAKYQALSSKLIVIGDEAWLETGQPCIVVSSLESDEEQPQKRTLIHHDFLSPQPRLEMVDQEFPLDKAEAAADYADRYAEGNEIVDLRLPLDVPSASEFAFDHEQNRFWRLAQVLAIHCATCVASGGRGKLATSETEKEVIAKALAEAVKFDAIMGTVGEPEAYLPELTVLAQRFDRKWFPGFAWGGRDKPLRKRFLEETVEMFLNRPINLFKLSN